MTVTGHRMVKYRFLLATNTPAPYRHGTVLWRGCAAERLRRRLFLSAVRPAATAEEPARLEPFLMPPSR